MSLLKGISSLFFILTIGFLILISLSGSILFILLITGLSWMNRARLSKMGSTLWKMLLITATIMSISCASEQIITPTNTETIEIIKTLDCNDPGSEKIFKATIKDLNNTIKNQNLVISKYQVDLDQARIKAEEAQKALGFIEYVENIFYFILFCIGLYLTLKIIKRAGFI